MVEKNVFIIFYQGDRAQSKISRICEAYGANLYKSPDGVKERKILQDEINGKISDLSQVLSSSKRLIKKQIFQISRYLPTWSDKVMRVLINPNLT